MRPPCNAVYFLSTRALCNVLDIDLWLSHHPSTARRVGCCRFSLLLAIVINGYGGSTGAPRVKIASHSGDDWRAGTGRKKESRYRKRAREEGIPGLSTWE